jgi:hypothetical protein
VLGCDGPPHPLDHPVGAGNPLRIQQRTVPLDGNLFGFREHGEFNAYSFPWRKISG